MEFALMLPKLWKKKLLFNGLNFFHNFKLINWHINWFHCAKLCIPTRVKSALVFCVGRTWFYRHFYGHLDSTHGGNDIWLLEKKHQNYKKNMKFTGQFHNFRAKDSYNCNYIFKNVPKIQGKKSKKTSLFSQIYYWI